MSYEHMSDKEKFMLMVDLIKTMSQEFKDLVLAELVGGNATGEAKVMVSSNNELVRVDFGRPLAWFAIPKAYAVQLGASLMQHGGAHLEQVERPKTDAS